LAAETYIGLAEPRRVCAQQRDSSSAAASSE